MIEKIKTKIQNREEPKESDKNQRFLIEKRKIINEINENERGQNTSVIVNLINRIIEADEVLPYYLLTSPTETEYLITTLIDKLVMLNSTSEFQLSLEELLDKLNFSHNALESLYRL